MGQPLDQPLPERIQSEVDAQVEQTMEISDEAVSRLEAIRPMATPEPRTDFTFFPDQEKQSMIAEHTPWELSHAVNEHPDLTVAFLHELWRTHRSHDIYAVGSINPDVMTYFTDEVPVVSRLVLMNVGHGQSLEDCSAFYGETISTLIKARGGQPLDRPLNEAQQALIENWLNRVIQYIDNFARKLKARLN
jgi:hypothetical protein